MWCSADTAAKRLQLLVEAIPHVSTVAVVWNAANPGNAGSWREVRDAARVLGIHVQSREPAYGCRRSALVQHPSCNLINLSHV